MLTLPDSLRDAFKEPLGPVYTDPAELLAAAERTRTDYETPDAPVVAVGDVVTYHLTTVDREPDVAFVDGKTEREETAADIREATDGAGDERVVVENPAATLSLKVLEALRDALAADARTVVEVIGEEDLVALPAIVAAPVGASVVYGQPGEGMVHVAVTPEAKAEARDLFERLDGDVAGAYRALGVDP